MKCFVILFALAAASTAAPSGYAYSPYPHPYIPYSPFPYYFGAPPGFSYSLAESAPAFSYIRAPAVSYLEPAPVAPVVAPTAPLAPAHSVANPVVAPPPAKTQYYSQNELGQARYGHDEPGQSHHAIQDAAGNKFGTFSYIRPDGKVAITQYTADEDGYKVASNDLPIGPGQPAPAEPSVPVFAVVAAEADVPVVPVADIPVVPVADVPVVPVAADSPALPVAADLPAAPTPDNNDDTIQVENVERSDRRKRAVLPNGYLADTPEVAAAKAFHFSEHAKAANNYYYYPHSSPLSYYPYAYNGYPYAYNAYPYSYAAPTVVTADGYVADTPEVAAAKAAHFTHHAIASSRSRRDTSSKQLITRSPAHTPASTSPLVAAPAPLVVPVAYAPYYHAVHYAPAPVPNIVRAPAYPYVYPWVAKK